MAAFIPSRRDPEVNAVALAKVSEDKRREAGDGFDGTWVAHPDLVPTAVAEFDAVLGERPNQVERKRDDVQVAEEQLVDFEIPGSSITDEGLRVNVSVGVRYIDSWLQGVGAAAIDNLMEDAATAEISRAQVWSWVQSARFEEERVREEIQAVDASEEAKEVFANVALSVPLKDFLTTEAYALLT
jgi:malate synthase